MTIRSKRPPSLHTFCSWSGGKDSCLALYKAIQQGQVPGVLFTMMVEGGEVSRSHALPRSLLEAQARQLGLPIVFRSATWNDYEDTFIEMLKEFKTAGIDQGVFGDIDVEPHLEWVQRVCKVAGITPIHPLWKAPRRALLEEFIALKFKATVVVVNESMLDASFLDRTIDAATVADMEKAGIDASGEAGEYHTVVTGGPLFFGEIPLVRHGIKHHEGYAFLPVSVRTHTPQ